MSKSTKIIYAITYLLIFSMLFILLYKLSGKSSADKTESDVSGVNINEHIDNEWALFLVNGFNSLPKDFSVQTAPVYNEYQLDSRIAPYLILLLNAAEVDAIKLNVISAYRTREYQHKLFSDSVLEYMSEGMSFIEATSATSRSIAPAGTSEHNAGVAVDIVSMDWFVDREHLTSDFDETDEFAWLKENSYKYGFIMRYPEDKTDITQIIYEPWHYRFVGVYHATKITEQGICLEEYMKQLGIE